MGFQKIAGGLLVFSLLSAGGGYFLRGSYPITPSEELEQVYPVSVSPLAAVFSYTDHTEEYGSSFLQDHFRWLERWNPLIRDIFR